MWKNGKFISSNILFNSHHTFLKNMERYPGFFQRSDVTHHDAMSSWTLLSINLTCCGWHSHLKRPRTPTLQFTNLAEGWDSATARNSRRVGGKLETTWHLDGIMCPADKPSYMSLDGVVMDQTEVPMSDRIKPWIIQGSFAVLWWFPLVVAWCIIEKDFIWEHLSVIETHQDFD